jgi:hypothetical protein
MKRTLVTTAIVAGCISAGSALAWMGAGGTTPGLYYDAWAPALFEAQYYAPTVVYVPSYAPPPRVRYPVTTLARAVTRVRVAVTGAHRQKHPRPLAVARVKHYSPPAPVGLAPLPHEHATIVSGPAPPVAPAHCNAC